jgi:hypothetical protein
MATGAGHLKPESRMAPTYISPSCVRLLTHEEVFLDRHCVGLRQCNLERVRLLLRYSISRRFFFRLRLRANACLTRSFWPGFR